MGECTPGVEALGDGAWKGHGSDLHGGTRILGAPLSISGSVEAFGREQAGKAESLVENLTQLPDL